MQTINTDRNIATVVGTPRRERGGLITATVTFTDDPEGTVATPYAFAKNDAVDYCARGWDELNTGKWGPIEDYTEERRLQDNKLDNIAVQSDLMQSANDVCQPLAEEKDLGIISDEDLARYKAWAVYRQKLRKVDLSADPVSWPAVPE